MIFSAQEYHQALSYERECFVCRHLGLCDHREPMVELALMARIQGRRRKNGSSARYHLEDSAPWRWDTRPHAVRGGKGK